MCPGLAGILGVAVATRALHRLPGTHLLPLGCANWASGQCPPEWKEQQHSLKLTLDRCLTPSVALETSVTRKSHFPGKIHRAHTCESGFAGTSSCRESQGQATPGPRHTSGQVTVRRRAGLRPPPPADIPQQAGHRGGSSGHSRFPRQEEKGFSPSHRMQFLSGKTASRSPGPQGTDDQHPPREQSPDHADKTLLSECVLDTGWHPHQASPFCQRAGNLSGQPLCDAGETLRVRIQSILFQTPLHVYFNYFSPD